jgi:sulfite reductase alpha subunit-like flavoprotein
VLLDFPSAAPLALARLLEAAPLLQPRYFSISSAPLVGWV